MRKLYFVLLISFFFQTLFSQTNEKKKYSFEVANKNIKEALTVVENETGYSIFYNINWFEDNSELITVTYSENTIEEILDSLFLNSDFNYYIDTNKIIITKNIAIESFTTFNILDTITKEKELTNKKSEPYFFKQEKKNNAVKTYFIGKENKSNSTKRFYISGKITNIDSGEPLPNIAVFTSDKKNYTVSDLEGNYKIILPYGKHSLEIQSVSYEKLNYNVFLYNNGILNVALEEKINLLEGIELKSQSKDNIKSTATGKITFTAEAVKNIPLVLGERDVLKVATIIPGIKTVGEGSSGFNVRGGKEDQNLFLIDDVVVYNPAHFFGFFSTLNPYTVKDVSIYKSSIPAEYGGRLSSVFDINTKTGNSEKLIGEASIGPVTGNVMISTPVFKEKSTLLIGARSTYSKWITKSIDNEQIKNSNASFYDGVLKYNHKINDKNEIETFAYISNDNFNITKDSILSYKNVLASIKWKNTLSLNTNFTLQASLSNYDYNIDFSNPEKDFQFGFSIQDNSVNLKFNTSYGAKHNLKYGINTKHYLIAPGYIQPKSLNSIVTPITIETEKGLESAAFIGDIYKVNENLTLNLGIRFSNFLSLGEQKQNTYLANNPKNEATVVEVKTYKHNEVIKSFYGFEPRVSGRYLLNNDYSIKASYDRTVQYIHLLSSNTTQTPLDTWKTSDLNIDPQSSDQISLGVYKNLKNDMFEVSLEGYYKKIKNILDYKVGASLLLNENIETQVISGVGKAYGFELLFKKNKGRINGWIGYTYSRTFIKLNGEFEEDIVNNGDYFQANFDKPHDLSIVFNYKFTQRYSLSSNFIYQTGRPITYPVGGFNYSNAQYTLYSDRNLYRIPDYYRLDIGLNIEGNHKLKKIAHSFWNVSIYNVLGTNNPYSVFFVTKEGQVKGYKTSIFAYPIPTITYNFKF